MPVTDPVLHVLAGPNGAGQTTLAERMILPVTHLPFVNADVLATRHGLTDGPGAYRADGGQNPTEPVGPAVPQRSIRVGGAGPGLELLEGQQGVRRISGSAGYVPPGIGS